MSRPLFFFLLRFLNAQSEFSGTASREPGGRRGPGGGDDAARLLSLITRRKPPANPPPAGPPGAAAFGPKRACATWRLSRRFVFVCGIREREGEGFLERRLGVTGRPPFSPVIPGFDPSRGKITPPFSRLCHPKRLRRGRVCGLVPRARLNARGAPGEEVRGAVRSRVRSFSRAAARGGLRTPAGVCAAPLRVDAQNSALNRRGPFLTAGGGGT